MRAPGATTRRPGEGRPAAVAPRKRPRQKRSAFTVDAIVEAAARLLERDGSRGYTTNHVAEMAGVSIGSLYQYFPNKDAITLALIERETRAVAAAARATLRAVPIDRALTALVEVAVHHQLDRPRLARLLEDEETRLEAWLDLSAEALGVREALTATLRPRIGHDAAALGADVVGVIRLLSDAAGSRGAGAARTVAAIDGAVRGLVEAQLATPMEE